MSLAIVAIALTVQAPTWARDLPPAKEIAATDIQIMAEGFSGVEGPSLLSDGTVVFMGGRDGLVGVSPGGQKQSVVSPLAAVGTALARSQNNILYATRMDMTRVTGGPGTPLKPRDPNSTAPGGAILRIDLSTKAVTPLYEKFNGELLVGPNKVAVDDAGDLWFTDVLEGWLYWGKSDGSELRRIAAFPVAHGITLSPDHRTVYVSSEEKLVSFKITGRGTVAMDGNMPKMTVVMELDPKWNVDGIRTEQNGNIVLTASDGLIVVSPKGEIVSQTKLPGLHITNLVFGGAGRQTLYLTARDANAPRTSNTSGKLIAIKWPQPGAKL